jgi:alkylation response protein AidB-like acyl-CoA dehydrogenase
VDFALSDEQSDFVDAIRDFCDRECGTQDQRERLTDGYRDHHNFDLYKQMAGLGWLGVTEPESGSDVGSLTCTPDRLLPGPAAPLRRPRGGPPRRVD